MVAPVLAASHHWAHRYIILFPKNQETNTAAANRGWCIIKATAKTAIFQPSKILYNVQISLQEFWLTLYFPLENRRCNFTWMELSTLISRTLSSSTSSAAAVAYEPKYCVLQQPAPLATTGRYSTYHGHGSTTTTLPCCWRRSVVSQRLADFEWGRKNVLAHWNTHDVVL